MTDKSADYTPTITDVQVYFAVGRYGENRCEGQAEFQRWLAEHDQQVKHDAWAEGVEYAKTQLRQDLEVADKKLAVYAKPIGNVLVQPCRDAMDASDGPWGYPEYDAHIASVQLSSAIDMLTVHPPMDIDGEHWDGDEDPNPYRASIQKTEADRG